jgi:catechol 2,3-dioxygenase-like lactoylglutathione lyase family enzyme
LTETGPGVLATRDGGEQLRLVEAPRRRLVELGVGAESSDDVARIARSLEAIGIPSERAGDALQVLEPASAVRVTVSVAPGLVQQQSALARANAPGQVARRNARADSFGRLAPVAPRKLGHVVIGSPDAAASRRFFVEGLGFKVSDEIAGVASFLRCSKDHHNVLVQAAPVAFLHHTAWQVDDVDEIGRGAQALIEVDPARHVWGLGRHHIGSNFFWYLRDPAGNFTEYYADLDCIVDDELWEPGVFEGAKSLAAWGPPVPRAFLMPDDFAELLAARQG